MSTANFKIKYDGAALSANEMDVRDLAPALLAIGELFDAANQTLNGDAAKISVKVKAHEPGSFTVDLNVIQSLIDQGLSFLTGDSVTAAINLRELIFGGFGLIWFIKILKGKNPSRIEKLSPDTVRITIDNESFDVPLKLLRVYQDVGVRTAVEKVVEKPLTRDGIDTFVVLEEKKEIIAVTKAEAVFFISPIVADKTLISDKRKAAFSIVSLAFKEDNKWRLNDGSTQISATINDKEFLSRVDKNLIRFSKGDILVCEVLFEQKQTSKGLVTEHTVEKVVEHIPAPRQLDLNITDSSENADNEKKK